MRRLYAEAGGEGEMPSNKALGLRNTAAKNVYDQLPEDEKRRIAQKVDKSGEEANPPDIQKK